MNRPTIFAASGILASIFLILAIFGGIGQKNSSNLNFFRNKASTIDALRLSDSLQGWWKFDEGTGTFITKDSSKNNLQGRLEGSPSRVSGKSGSALLFDGIDDAYVGALPAENFGNSTIALWVNISSALSPLTPLGSIPASPLSTPTPLGTGGDGGAFVKVGSPLNGIGIGIGSQRFDYQGSELIGLFEYSRWIPTGRSISSGWHHLAMVVDGTSPIFYLDGALIGSFPGSQPLAPGSEIRIGGYTATGGLERFAKAAIDDVRVYNKALTEEEVRYVMNNTNIGFIPNNPPVAISDSFVINYETATTISLNGRDADVSDTLTFNITRDPIHGTLVKSRKVSNLNQKYIYTPHSGYSGTDSFEFSVTDNRGASGTTTIPLTVNPRKNAAPLALDASALTLHNTPITVTLDGTDADAGDTLQVSIVSHPGNGALSNFAQVTPRQVRYTYWPVLGFTGIDSFTFKWNDGKADSNVGTARITVNPNGPVNNVPIASSTTALTLENTPITVTLSGVDADAGDTLTISIVANPSRGALSNFFQINSRQVRYTYWPTAGFIGTDSFTFKFNDGKADSNVGTATITINPNGQPNTPPSALSFSTTTSKNTPVVLALSGSDANNDPLTYSIVASPSNGSLALVTSPNIYRYTPSTDHTGFDSFTYKVNDGKVDSNIATVSLNITSPSSPLSGSISYPPWVQLYAHDPTKRKPADQNLNLQQALDKYGSLRLENKSYTRPHVDPTSLTINSNQKLYGLPGTGVPRITIAPGAQNILISRVSSDTLTFPASSLVTSNNVFRNLPYTNLVIDNATLEDNVFLDFNFSKIDSDTRSGGYLRNNRFIRFRSQSVYPQITMRGSLARPSYGNVFLGFNILTPPGEGVNIDGQTDITFVAGDAENWNSQNVNTKPLFTVTNTSLFTSYGLNGGGGNTGMFNTSANLFRLIGAYINSSTVVLPNIALLPGAAKAFIVSHDLRTQSDSNPPGPGIGRFKAFQEFLGLTPNYNGTDYLGNLTSAAKTDVLAMLNPARTGVAWETPVYDPIPDPGGPSWNQNLNTKVATTSGIQNDYINKNQILPPGTYYIDAPLHLSSTTMLWGSGASSTVIIAKNSSFDMIRSSEHRNGPWMDGTQIKIGDITLQGGRNGVHLDAAGAGAFAQINEAVISNVTMRNIANAGIFVNGIYAIDNVFFDHVNIVDSGYGLRQIPPTGCIEQEGPGINYVDKLFFYQSQFVRNGIALEMLACRTNNANTCINCLFKDNATAAARLEKNTSAFFVNSDFIGNGGTLSLPTISDKKDGGWSNNIIIVNSRFKAGPAQAILGAHRIDVEGSTFEKGSVTGAKIIAGAEKVTFSNNTSDFSVGDIKNGLFFNNSFPTGDSKNDQMIYFKDSTPYILIPGNGIPSPQLLFGSQLPSF